MMIDDKLSVMVEMRLEFKPESMPSIARFETFTAFILTILVF
jgi:hypothetical protein